MSKRVVEKMDREKVLKRAGEILLEVETLLGPAATEFERRARSIAFEAGVIRIDDINRVLKSIKA